MENFRERIKNKKRIVVKIGSSSLIHTDTGNINFIKMEKLCRILCDLNNQGKEVILVSSGAIGVGYKALGLMKKPTITSRKQACAAVGQAQLMMIYQKLFGEYGQMSAQILMTKDVMLADKRRENAQNTFEELLSMGVIPVVNENDTVSTEEIEFGDNDTLSAVVCALVRADLLILLSDIDGLYTDDPRINENAKFISLVEEIDDNLVNMGKGASTNLGTGGMATKISAAMIATDSGADMIITNGEDLSVIPEIFNGEDKGTLFLAHKRKNFNLMNYLQSKSYLV